MPASKPQPSAAETAIVHALNDPQAAIDALDRIECAESLIAFMARMWHVLEPSRKFVISWPLVAICDHLEAVSRGEITRLLINVPPGFTKSMAVNVFWPAWEWGPKNQPHLRYVSASYHIGLTVRDNRRTRQLIQSEDYQRLWGDRFALSGDQNAKIRYDTDKTGFRFSTSVGGAATGERGDRVIVDDPHSVAEAESDAKREEARYWFTETLPTRLNDLGKGEDAGGEERPPSAVVVIMQRVHEEDVSGLIIDKQLGYEHLCIPMEYEVGEDAVRSSTSLDFVDPRTEEGELACPERFSREALDKDLYPVLRSLGGEYAIAGQMQQRPVPRGGGMFPKENWKYVRQAELPKLIKVTRGWDFAASERKKRGGATARSAAVQMAMGRAPGKTSGPADAIYILDVICGWWGPNELEVRFKKQPGIDGVDCVISFPQDPGQAGKVQKHAYAKHLHGYTFEGTPESGEKEVRAGPLASQQEAHNVYLVEAGWNDDFVAEAASFPRGRLKDLIDAASRAYGRILKGHVVDVPEPPELIGR